MHRAGREASPPTRLGRIVAAFPQANKVSEDELGEYMLGIKSMTAEEMAGVL